MNDIIELFNVVKNTSGKIAKESLLESFENQELIGQIMTDTYGPNKYNIKNFTVSKTGDLNINTHYNEFRHLLKALSNKEVTGNQARNEANRIISMFDSKSQDILINIISKNLKIGIGNTFAKNTGSTEKFPVRLANSLEKAKNVDVFDNQWFISRKLDGSRCLTFIEITEKDINVIFRSRQNKEIKTLGNLVPSIKELFKNHAEGYYVLDGEICITDEYGNESFSGLMSELGRKDHTIEFPKYYIYDFMTQDVFFGTGNWSPVFATRINEIKKILDDRYIKGIKILEQIILSSPEMLSEYQATAEKNGWEGLMLSNGSAPYEGKRTNNLLKVKKFKDSEYIVLGIETGTHSRNTKDGVKVVKTTSALIISHKGNEVRVGSGLTQEQRDAWFDNPELIIGKEINVRYFEESKDKKTGLLSLRFPTLYHVYEEGRNF